MNVWILAGLLLTTSLAAQPAVPFKGGPLQVSENGRFLVKTDGTPFFWMGDTAWELFHRLDREEADRYLKRRAEQGFTVIQAVALAELDGLNTPNALGEVPLVNNDPGRPNEAYFRHVDFILDRAADYGLVIALLPTWGDKLFKSTWGKGPEIFNPANAREFGRWIGDRYRRRENIVWISGGDRTPREGTDDVAVWRALAEGIAAGTGGNDKALMSFHPQPNSLEMGGSSHWYHQDAWLDFNMLQNGHCRNTATYAKITHVYNKQPVKPVIDGEPAYEDHPVCFNRKELGLTNAHDVRMYAYLDLFAGAFGHTYGCHDVWQMYTPERESVNGAAIPWYEALELPGANQMQWVRRLITSRPVLDRVPDQSLIRENDLPAAERIQATRGKDYAFIYTTAGLPFEVQPGKIAGAQWVATWYDPKNGAVKPAGTFASSNPVTFRPPSSGYGHDWVLILDDASKGYPIPEDVKNE